MPDWINSLTWRMTAGAGFMVGVIFWAGATYNRVVGIEQSLLDIRAQLPALSRVAVLDTEMQTMQKQIDRLQEESDRRRGAR